MSIQMILCVETNKRADTDYIYISETIKHLYKSDKRITINKVYMGSKTKYKSKEVLSSIKQLTKAFTIGETRVIYCIDTDAYETDMEHKKVFDDISRFCEENEYELIWFCHDIEDVYIGKKISDSQKVQEAGAFRKKNRIEEMDLTQLSGDIKRAHTSNILCILDKYFSRK